MLSKNSTRVTLLGPSWPFRGGIPKYTTRLAKELYQRGNLVDFITPFKQYPSFLYPGKTDRDPQACQKLDFAKPLFSYLEPWTWAKVPQAIHSSGAQKVLVPFWTKAQIPFLNYLQKQLAIPQLTILHNLFDHDSGGLTQRFVRNTLKRNKEFFCHSQEMLEDPLFHFSNIKTRYHILPPLGESKTFCQKTARDFLGIPQSQLVFLFFGLIRPYKGLSVLLKACESLANRNFPFTLLIAGEPWGKLSLPSPNFSMISHLKWVPEQEVAAWFSACDIVVAPYLRASGSAVIAQAISYRKPIITTPVGGIPDQLTGYQTYFYSTPGNSSSLAEAMLKAVSSQGIPNPTKPSIANHSWESYVDCLLS
jgi:glycosyltransferase involved in cell wall biosynthesis